jgi:hypothetical protein
MIDDSGGKLRWLARIQLALTVVFAVLTVLAVALPMWIRKYQVLHLRRQRRS